MKREYTGSEKFVLFILKTGLFIGIIMIVGGVGSIDFADEMGEMLSRSEEARSYLTSFAGILIAGICGVILSKVD